MTLLLRLALSLLLAALGLLVTVSTLVGTEQTWGLRQQPFPVLLVPAAAFLLTLLLIRSVWKIEGRGVPFMLLAWLGVAGVLVWFLGLLH